MPKITKLSSLTQADGKLKDKTPLSKKQQIDKIFGDDGSSKFGTIDESVFVQKLEDLSNSVADMQNFAAQYGIKATDDIKDTKRKLLDEFRTHVQANKGQVGTTSTNSKITKEIRAILAGGR